MRDSVLEAWFERNGIKVDYLESLGLHEIIVEQSAIQNIRLGLPLNQDHVVQYAIDMEAGAQFPAIVVYKVGKGKYIGKYGVINGLHRLRSMLEVLDPPRKLGDAYVVKTTDDHVIEMLQRTVNIATGGIPLNEEERIEHALRLLALNYSIVDAARLMSIKVSKLQSQKAYQDSLAKLRAAGISTKDLSKGSILLLKPIPRDKYFFKAVELSRAARLSSEDMHELATQLKNAPNDAAMDKIFKEWEGKTQDRVARVRKGLTRGPASAIYSLPAVMTRAGRILRAPGNLSTLTIREIDDMIRLISKTMSELRHLIDTMKKIRAKAS